MNGKESEASTVLIWSLIQYEFRLGADSMYGASLDYEFETFHVDFEEANVSAGRSVVEEEAVTVISFT
jgi:hypothetical protein